MKIEDAVKELKQGKLVVYAPYEDDPSYQYKCSYSERSKKIYVTQPDDGSIISHTVRDFYKCYRDISNPDRWFLWKDVNY